MSEYKPTEYVVDFGDGRSNSFVRLNMALLRENGSKLVDRVVRCRDCKYAIHFFHHDDERWQCTEPYQEGVDVKPDGYCWRGKRKDGSE